MENKPIIQNKSLRRKLLYRTKTTVAKIDERKIHHVKNYNNHSSIFLIPNPQNI